MWTALKIVSLIALCYLAVTVWIFLSQRKMLYFPTTSSAGSPADAGLHFTDVELVNDMGNRLHGWWIPHENARFTLLFAHGNGGNISHRVPSLEIFHRLGLSVFIYDYSGYGRSEGSPGEEETGSDARAAWRWLTYEQGVAPGSIILFGRSLGGAVTARLAHELIEKGQHPAGLIFESTFTSIPDMGAYIYPWLPVRQLARYRYDSVAELRPVRSPALFLHSPDDDIVPYAIGRRLFEAYDGPKSFMELKGDHNTGFLETGQPYVDALDRFVRKLEQD